jgi:hypothetical protein
MVQQQEEEEESGFSDRDSSCLNKTHSAIPEEYTQEDALRLSRLKEEEEQKAMRLSSNPVHLEELDENINSEVIVKTLEYKMVRATI